MQSDIEEIVNRETEAWDKQDIELLLSIFHKDFVWVWPNDPNSHDPLNWRIKMGKFDYERWKSIYSDMFSKYSLVKNNRKILKIELSKEGNGAFAVLDVDTLWRDQEGDEMHWTGKACKIYSKTEEGWKLIGHTGLLQY